MNGEPENPDLFSAFTDQVEQIVENECFNNPEYSSLQLEVNRNTDRLAAAQHYGERKELIRQRDNLMARMFEFEQDAVLRYCYQILHFYY